MPITVSSAVSRLEVLDDPDVEARPAHVGGDDVAQVGVLGQPLRADHAADRAGTDRRDRAVLAVLEWQHPAVGLHQHQAVAEAELGQAAVERREVPGGARTDVGVDDRGDRPLVLADRSGEFLRGRDERAGSDLLHDLAGALLVGRVLDRPEEADGKGLAPLLGELADGALDLVLVERDEDVADGVHAFGDPADVVAGDDRLGLVSVGDVEDALGRLAGDPAETTHHQQRVLVAFGREQTDLGSLELDDDVRGHGRAVRHEPCQACEQLVVVIPALLRRRAQAPEESRLEVVRRRAQRLAIRDPPFGVDDHAVGERASDVDRGDQRLIAGRAGCCHVLLLVAGPRREI